MLKGMHGRMCLDGGMFSESFVSFASSTRNSTTISVKAYQQVSDKLLTKQTIAPLSLLVVQKKNVTDVSVC